MVGVPGRAGLRDPAQLKVVTVQALELGRGDGRTLMDLPTAVQMMRAVDVSFLPWEGLRSVRRNTRTEETMLR